MIADCGAPIVFVDAEADAALAAQPVAATPRPPRYRRLHRHGSPPKARGPRPVTIAPGDGFNIIYSSGTTGTPKGIVQSHAMRWAHIHRNSSAGFGDAVTMIATPLYSNTTLVSFLPTLGWGGTVVLMKKFDARAFLEMAAGEPRRPTRCWSRSSISGSWPLPDFDSFDLSSFRLKTCTSAPFSAALKADVVARWPGSAGRILRHDRGRRHLACSSPSMSRTSSTPSAARSRITTSA